MIAFDLTGIDQCCKMAERYFNKQLSAAMHSTIRGARMVRSFANDNITPVDTGLMVNTSYESNVYLSVECVGAQIVYPQPYAIWVELNPQGYLHGQPYNVKHSDDIQSGRDHSRRPGERDHFLTTSVMVKKNEVYQLIKRTAQRVSIG